MNLIGCIVTKNEEEYLDVSLSGMGFMDKVYVVDNGSTDRTLEIASGYRNVEIIKVKIDLPHSVGTQRNAILDRVGDDNWLYFSDGDEYITEPLSNEIKSIVGGKSVYGAYQVPRLNFFLGRPLHHGGWYPDYQIRLIKKSVLSGWVQGPLLLPPVIFDSKYKYLLKAESGPHDNPLLKNGTQVGTLKNHYLHFNHRNINSMMYKTVRFNDSEVSHLNSLNKVEEPKLLSFISKPLIEFIKRYIYHRGFIDGKVGIIESIYQAFSVFLLEARKWEITQIPDLETKYENYKKKCVKKSKKF